MAHLNKFVESKTNHLPAEELPWHLLRHCPQSQDMRRAQQVRNLGFWCILVDASCDLQLMEFPMNIGVGMHFSSSPPSLPSDGATRNG